MKELMQSGKSAILIRCTREEAEVIRRTAKQERRTLSGFALKVLLEYITRAAVEIQRTA
jgi:uncharacterized protein (DUF1778 family)